MLILKFKIRLSRGTPGHPGTPRDTPGHPGTGCPGGPRDMSRGVPGCPGDPRDKCPGDPRDVPRTLVPGSPGTPRDMSPVPTIIDSRNHAGTDFPRASLYFGASGLGPASLDLSVSWLWTCSLSPISIGVSENRSCRKNRD